MEYIKEVILVSGLFVNSIIDIKKKKISVAVIILMAIGAICIDIYYENFSIIENVFSFVPGVILLIVSAMSNQSIGYGDGLLILCMGLFICMENIFFVCMIAVSIAGIVAMILVLICNKKRNYEIPLVPFIFLGYGLMRGMI